MVQPVKLPDIIEKKAPLSPEVNHSDLLQDSYGRVMRKLRVSLTDACNYRCFYCMPENAIFSDPTRLLNADEYYQIVNEMVKLGLQEIRVTGGEPTIRPDFINIMKRISETKPHSLGLTTNGQILGKFLPELKALHCHHINISVDSLDSGKFHRITRGGHLEKVLRSVFAARDMGFHVKVNAVAFGGINDDEMDDFARFSEQEGIEVRFLEFMKIGPEYQKNYQLFVEAETLIAKLRQKRDLIPVPVPADSTSFIFRTPAGGRLGFIASESKPFCGGCSRLRLTAHGTLKACLMSEKGISLRQAPKAEWPEILRQVITYKPIHRLHHVDHAMHTIGG